MTTVGISQLSVKMDGLLQYNLFSLWINFVLLAVFNQSTGAPVFSSTSSAGDYEFEEAIVSIIFFLIH